jgi:hypothetical protein
MKPRPNELIQEEKLKELFPTGRDDEFFDAFYGGSEDGAFDIFFSFDSYRPDNSELIFGFNLKERPGKCMACNLTYGLPSVFEKSPIINLKRIINGINEMIAPHYEINGFMLGKTTPKAPKVNVIPLIIKIKNGD